MSEHQPQAGRRAYRCAHKDHEKDVAPRKFAKPGEPLPECKTHGKMKLQENRPYMGQEIPDGG